MVNQNTLGSAVMKMRLEQENACREQMRLAQEQLEASRTRIYQLEEQADAFHYAAIVAHAEGDEQAARLHRRHQRQLVFARAKEISELADAKMRFGQARQQLHDAIQRRTDVNPESLRNINNPLFHA